MRSQIAVSNSERNKAQHLSTAKRSKVRPNFRCERALKHSLKPHVRRVTPPLHFLGWPWRAIRTSYNLCLSIFRTLKESSTSSSREGPNLVADQRHCYARTITHFRDYSLNHCHYELCISPELVMLRDHNRAGVRGWAFEARFWASRKHSGSTWKYRLRTEPSGDLISRADRSCCRYRQQPRHSALGYTVDV